MTGSPIKVGVFGAGGRMGATVCDAVVADAGLQLVAAVDPVATGRSVHGVTIVSDASALSSSGVDIDVMVDFTVAAASRDNLAWCAAHGVHAVVGTTGFSDEDYTTFRSAFTSSNCLIAANFAISVDDEVRRTGRPMVRHRRDHRVASRQQGRCAEWNGRRHRPPYGRSVVVMGVRPHHPRGDPGRTRG